MNVLALMRMVFIVFAHLTGEGPAFFGDTSINVKHVSIKNGILGLTSHFGIHGNFAQDIEVCDVRIRDFVTHGIQLNGWENLNLNNIEIGPNSNIDYLKGEFGHGRLMLQRLEKVRDLMSDDDIDTKSVTFSNLKEAATIEDLMDDLEAEMGLAYHYAVNRISSKFEESDYIDPSYLEMIDTSRYDDLEEGQESEQTIFWHKVKKAYIQESGFPASSSVSGMFLNYDGASVFSYAKYVSPEYHSNSAVLSNIYVHDLSHEMIETVRIASIDEGAQV